MRTKLTQNDSEKLPLEKLENGLVRCEDGLLRPEWAAAPGIMRDYYDTEWGVPIRTDQGIYERLCLEAFQAGLSWKTILVRRPALRKAFADFDPSAVAAFDDNDIDRLVKDPSIIRNRRKIEAARTNAQQTLRLQHDPNSQNLVDLVWSFAPKNPQRPRSISELHPTSPESIALSKRLKKEGFVFVGPTTVMSTMEAIGAIDTHVVGAFCATDLLDTAGAGNN